MSSNQIEDQIENPPIENVVKEDNVNSEDSPNLEGNDNSQPNSEVDSSEQQVGADTTTAANDEDQAKTEEATTEAPKEDAKKSKRITLEDTNKWFETRGLTQPSDVTKPWADTKSFLTELQAPVAQPIAHTLSFLTNALNAVNSLFSSLFAVLRLDTDAAKSDAKDAWSNVKGAAESFMLAVVSAVWQTVALLVRAVATPVIMAMNFFSKKKEAEANKEEAADNSANQEASGNEKANTEEESKEESKEEEQSSSSSLSA